MDDSESTRTSSLDTPVTGSETPPYTLDSAHEQKTDDIPPDDTNEEQSRKINDSKVQSIYRGLVSRRVDLIGDYAGAELFLIEGDSLLLHCFSDENLDFNHGFQLLHAVYNVEQFLHQLARRKANFKIVFFDCNDHLCVPESADRTQISKFLLARAVIIRHLSVALRNVHPDISIKTFESWKSPEFVQYMLDTSSYFLMVHDGAQPNTGHVQGVSDDNETTPNSSKRILLRTMILSLMEYGSNIALVNEVQWKDSKVITVVLEKSRQTMIPQNLSDNEITKSGISTRNVDTELKRLNTHNTQFDERQILAVIVTSIMLKDRPAAVAAAKWSGLCYDFLMHQALLAHMRLYARRNESIVADESEKAFIESMALISTKILHDASWVTKEAVNDVPSGIADYMDGRLFLQVSRQRPQMSSEIRETYAELVAAVKLLVDTDTLTHDDEQPSRADPIHSQKHLKVNDQPEEAYVTLLPFSNTVFDEHLKCVHIRVDASATGNPSLTSRKIFKEVSHWHNSEKPLVTKGPPVPIEAWQAKKIDRRNQRLMAEMQKYAASLTNAVGRVLTPETVIVKQSKSGTKNVSTEPSSVDIEAGKVKSNSKKGGGAKTNAKNAAKTAMLAKQALNQAQKAASATDKSFTAWEVVCKNIDIAKDPRVKYRKALHYLGNLQQKLPDVISVECELYLINCLATCWNQVCQKSQQSQHLHIVALMWNHLQNIAKRGQQSKLGLKYITSTVDSLGLPPLPQTPEVVSNRKPAFTLNLPEKTTPSVKSKDFQLVHCGAYFERSFNSEPDPRVDFRPDEWQRRVLDCIDNDQSVFVVAPTSAGKTFISFYAMRKVLEADDEGVLVYVAPTKALVNQIAAEIQGRYSKSFKHGGKSVWAIHTRDHRINNPNGCQVLVTVPHVLQIMLLAPSNAKSWSNRIKRIIFDEIHAIGQAEDGVVWEQLLLMAPSPIIALSATVGNPTEFADWLASTQNSIGHELTMIEHPYRYSDLRKYYYVPPRKFEFAGLPEKTLLNDLSLDELPGLNFINPVAALVDKSRGIPDDLTLEPRDCLYLWQAMKEVETEAYAVPNTLNPESVLPKIPRQQDVLKWEKLLKMHLRKWLGDPASPFDKLMQKLEQSFRNDKQEELYSTKLNPDVDTEELERVDDPINTTFPLLCRLHERDALPAIFFNYDRRQCEQICQSLLKDLVDAEIAQVKSGPKWEKKLEDWEVWKVLKKKAASIDVAASLKKASKKAKDKSDDADQSLKTDARQESSTAEDQKWERFDPEAPEDGYHFADHSKLQSSEITEYLKELRYRDVQPWLIEAIGRGIGVHHSGMNRKYRQVVEILFRKRFLRVIVATGTLALGINMPCKTVVFSGDSVYLTALNFRQCAGRAGRRGFDLMGNVVFQSISRQKVCRLITSRLPSLTGHFPITTSFVLRLFILLHESGNSEYAVTAINSVLSQPRLHMGGKSFKDQTMHHLRFSIEYLRRQHLLDSDGAPLNFAGLISHLYYTENSSFAFHALIKEGYMNALCANIDDDEKGTLETLMLVMSHLFCRIMHRSSDMEALNKVAKKSSSMIHLPPLPDTATNILREHNQEILKVYEAYVRTFIDQHISDDCDTLPLSGMKCGGNGTNSALVTQSPTHIRSAFVALSGADDKFTSIHDLCSTVRSGVFLEEAVIPYIPIYPEDMAVPLNAWLLDFYKHGDVVTLERDNAIRRSDVWFHLNDFSLILATIVTSMTNFLKPGREAFSDMLDLQGQMDVFEEKKDDESSKLMEQSNESAKIIKAAPPTIANQKVKTKEKLLESWDDVDETVGSNANGDQTEQGGNSDAEELEAWDVQEEDSLRNVLKAFQKLQINFNEKFKAMWA